MKRCPFCAEEIQDAAIKCRYCHEFLDGSSRPAPHPPAPPQESLPWFFRTSYLVLTFLILGPLAPLMLPLIWWHPKMTRLVKGVLTAAIVLASWLMINLTIMSLRHISALYAELGTMLHQ